MIKEIKRLSWRDRLKAVIKRTFAQRGFYLGRLEEANSLENHLAHLFGLLGVNCVLDVGAHVGDYGSELRRLGYRGRIVSFEPVSEHFAALNRRAAGDAAWRVYPYALGAEDGNAAINVFSGSTFSSFLPASEFGVSRFGAKMGLERIETVPVKRIEGLLDECLAGIERPRVLLKMDTQGYDDKVIQGLGAALDRIAALQTEITVKPLYQKMTTGFMESITHLQGLGFELSGLFPVTRDPQDRLSVLEFDCVMHRPAGAANTTAPS